VSFDVQTADIITIGLLVLIEGLLSADNALVLAILVLGLGLVLLGATWERLRGNLMDALPDFPGKDRLPPWSLHATKVS